MINCIANTVAQIRSNLLFDAEKTVFLIFDIGQSNSVGRGTAQRIIQLTTYKEAPDGVLIYYKPDYTSADNGAFQVLQEGSLNTIEPDIGASGMCGAYGMLAANLKRLTPDNNVYIVMAADGGTALKQNLTSPDWAPASSGECFQRATEYYYSVAYDKVVTANPDKTIIPIICWHQGESDAPNATAVSEYPANFSALVTALRASHSSLSNAMLIITKLFYRPDTTDEEAINDAFQAYADANSSLVKIVDISDINRKQDLTVDEQGGVAVAGNADEHTSYLGQKAKAERSYVHIKTKYAPSVDDSEITGYNFNVATISPNGVWLPLSRDYVTIGTYSTITAVQNLLNIGTFSTITGSPKFKLANRKGCLAALASTTPGLVSSAPIGASIIDGSFSFSGFFKPRDGNPSSSYTLWYDIANVSSINQARAYVFLTTTGKIQAGFALGSLVLATTASAVFTDSNQLNEKHIAVVWPQGGTVEIYVDGVLQSLDGTENGDISAFTLSNYANATFGTNFFKRRTGSSTFDLYYNGSARHITLQPVRYTVEDIQSLMLN